MSPEAVAVCLAGWVGLSTHRLDGGRCALTVARCSNYCRARVRSSLIEISLCVVYARASDVLRGFMSCERWWTTPRLTGGWTSAYDPSDLEGSMRVKLLRCPLLTGILDKRGESRALFRLHALHISVTGKQLSLASWDMLHPCGSRYRQTQTAILRTLRHPVRPLHSGSAS
jgi:hypothetical protein